MRHALSFWISLVLAAGCADSPEQDGPRRGDIGGVLPVDRDTGKDGAPGDGGATDLGPDVAPDDGAPLADGTVPGDGALPADGSVSVDAAPPVDGAVPDALPLDALPPEPDAEEPPDAGIPDAFNPEATEDVVRLLAIPSDGLVRLEWQAPADPRWAGVVLVRAEAPIHDRPLEGTVYRAGDAVGASTVVFAGESLRWLDQPLENGTRYYYRVFSYAEPGRDYSRGARADARPAAPQPSEVEHFLAANLGDAVLGYDFVVNPVDGEIHAVAIGEDDNGRRAWYLRCDPGCADAGDWHRTSLAAGINDRVGPSITLDLDGHPIIALDASYATCAAGCDVGDNWTIVALPEAVVNSVTTGIVVDAFGTRWIATSELSVWHCERVCSNAANWTRLPLGDSARVSMLGAGPGGEMVLTTSRWNGNNFDSELWSCPGECGGREAWAVVRVASTAGSHGGLDYRFTRAHPGGAHLLGGYDRRYRACSDCAPELPPNVRIIDQQRLYSYIGFGLELSAADQPRLLGSDSRPFFWYSTCDLDCADPANWREQQLGQENPRYQRFRLDEAGFPVALYVAYGAEGELRVLRTR